MLRIHLRFPPRSPLPTFKSNDLVHDSILAGLRARGLATERLIGAAAASFTFATHAFVRGKELALRGVTISTASAEMARALADLEPATCRCSRARTGETLSLAGCSLEPIDCPIADGTRRVGVLMLSPLVVDDPAARGRWLDRFDAAAVTTAVNRGLSRTAGRPTALEVAADSLYLRLNPNPRRRVVVRIDSGTERYVFGLALPLVLEGPTEDLRLAWAAGIGRKTRMGFGCFDLVERGLSGRASR